MTRARAIDRAIASTSFSDATRIVQRMRTNARKLIADCGEWQHEEENYRYSARLQ